MCKCRLSTKFHSYQRQPTKSLVMIYHHCTKNLILESSWHWQWCIYDLLSSVLCVVHPFCPWVYIEYISCLVLGWIWQVCCDLTKQSQLNVNSLVSLWSFQHSLHHWMEFAPEKLVSILWVGILLFFRPDQLSMNFHA